MKKRLALLLVLFALPVLAEEAWLVPLRIRDYSSGQPRQTMANLLICGTGMQMDTSPFSGQRTEAVYRSDLGTLWLIQHDKQTVMPINEQTITRLSNGMQLAASVFKDLTQSAAEPAEPRLPLEITQLAETADIGGRRCFALVATRGGVKQQEAWFADWSSVPMTAKTMQPLRTLAAAYDRIFSSSSSSQMFQDIDYVPMTALLRADGFPVALRHFENGRLMYEIRTGDPQPKDASPTRFTRPAGYKTTVLGLHL